MSDLPSGCLIPG